jgi:hypothetical protein
MPVAFAAAGDKGADWRAMAWWIHDHLPYSEASVATSTAFSLTIFRAIVSAPDDDKIGQGANGLKRLQITCDDDNEAPPRLTEVDSAEDNLGDGVRSTPGQYVVVVDQRVLKKLGKSIGEIRRSAIYYRCSWP